MTGQNDASGQRHRIETEEEWGWIKGKVVHICTSGGRKDQTVKKCWWACEWNRPGNQNKNWGLGASHYIHNHLLVCSGWHGDRCLQSCHGCLSRRQGVCFTFSRVSFFSRPQFWKDGKKAKCPSHRVTHLLHLKNCCCFFFFQCSERPSLWGWNSLLIDQVDSPGNGWRQYFYSGRSTNPQGAVPANNSWPAACWSI